MRGIILAGGKGTRLLPATKVINKHMIPIINIPMIEYPLKTLSSLGCTDILIISGGNHIGDIAEYLGSGERYNLNLTYKVQEEAGGIAQALSLAEDFAGTNDILVILGDNIFGNLDNLDLNKGASIFVKEIDKANRFGVLIDGKIIEKPQDITRGLVVTGLYHYPPEVFQVIKTLKPSQRGELEITDVNNYFLEKGECRIQTLDTFWSDAGTPESLLNTINYLHVHK